jgi:hypothetical protein
VKAKAWSPAGTATGALETVRAPEEDTFCLWSSAASTFCTQEFAFGELKAWNERVSCALVGANATFEPASNSPAGWDWLKFGESTSTVVAASAGDTPRQVSSCRVPAVLDPDELDGCDCQPVGKSPACRLICWARALSLATSAAGNDEVVVDEDPELLPPHADPATARTTPTTGITIRRIGQPP